MSELADQALKAFQFLSVGFRDAAVDSAFTAVMTATLILIGARLSGRRLTQVDLGGINLTFAAKETAGAYKSRGQIPPTASALKRELKPLIGNRKVLWVDDHPSNNIHEMKALSALGFSFTKALSNQEAVAALKSQHFDLIISDIGRDSGESGLDILREARELVADTAVIFYVSKVTSPKVDDRYPVVSMPDALFKEIERAFQ